MRSPTTGKEMKLIRENRKFTFRNVELEYIHQAFKDEENDELNTTTWLDKLNLRQIYSEYRKTIK